MKVKKNIERKEKIENIALAILIISAFSFLYLVIEPRIVGYFLFDSTYAPLSNPTSPGIDGQNKIETYHRMMNALISEENVTKVVNDKLWVPWYTSSSSCTINELHGGDSCNIGTINMDNNCMVSDELSQVGMLIAMGNNQEKMNQYFNTIKETKSNYGTLVSWRVAKIGNDIIPCHANVNGNCDAASDADARILISLYTGAANKDFHDSEKKTEYLLYANQMAKDFYEYNLVKECKNSNLGQGHICYWLAAGPNAKIGGLESGDFTYTGYYPDAIISMLQACSNTQNDTYCKVAGNLTLNYLQAAEYNGSEFRVPPGMSFRWTNLSGTPSAQCTRNCNPPSWDDADAPRALMICQANYYAKYIGMELPLMDSYCNQLYTSHMTNSNSAPLQFYQNGTPSSSFQTGYYAQGLQAIMLSGSGEKTTFNEALQNAINHYNPSLDTWNDNSCFGIYRQYFPMRALGFGIGRSLDSFPNNIILSEPTGISYLSSNPQQSYTTTSPGNTEFRITLSNPQSEQIDYEWRRNGTIVDESVNTYNFVGSEGLEERYNITVTATGGNETVRYEWAFRIMLIEESPISISTMNPSTTEGLPAQYTVSDAITITAGINNPSDIDYNVRWNANSSDFDERYGTSLSTTITPFSLAPGKYKIDAVINSSINSINHAFYIVINPTQPQVETPSQSVGTGGGGGGAPARPHEIENQETTDITNDNTLSQTNELDDIAREIRVKSIITDYYTGINEMSAEELILNLRSILNAVDTE